MPLMLAATKGLKAAVKRLMNCPVSYLGALAGDETTCQIARTVSFNDCAQLLAPGKGKAKKTKRTPILSWFKKSHPKATQ
jgi:hypothetical protein